MNLTRAEHLLHLIWRAKGYTEAGGHGMLPSHLPADLWEAMRDGAEAMCQREAGQNGGADGE